LFPETGKDRLQDNARDQHGRGREIERKEQLRFIYIPPSKRNFPNPPRDRPERSKMLRKGDRRAPRGHRFGQSPDP